MHRHAQEGVSVLKLTLRAAITNRKRGNLKALDKGNDIMCKVSRVCTSAVNKIQGKNDIQVYTTTRLGLCFAIVLTLQPSYQRGKLHGHIMNCRDVSY
jgi:hypothetical protein